MTYRRLLMITMALAMAVLTAGCGDKSTDESANNGNPPPVWAFTCGDEHVLALLDDNGALLVAADGVRRLDHLESASGALYAGPADTLWNKGDEGKLTRAGGPAGDCRTSGRQRVLADAWRSGVIFLAAGNEPSWNLRATADNLVLLTPGNPPLELSLASPLRPGTTHIVAGNGNIELQVRLGPGPWLDTMSGEPFPLSADVTVGERHLHGGCLYFPPPGMGRIRAATQE
ncbi:hypothetical protein DRQ50_01930 [bacterium]|nr:MAG: hypothetical protein DRQ50_01930 [bacterium]